MKNKLLLLVCLAAITLNVEIWTVSSVWSLRIMTLTLSNLIIMTIAVYQKIQSHGDMKK